MYELQLPAIGRKLGAWQWNSTYSKAGLYKEVVGHAYILNIFTLFLLVDLIMTFLISVGYKALSRTMIGRDELGNYETEQWRQIWGAVLACGMKDGKCMRQSPGYPGSWPDSMSAPPDRKWWPQRWPSAGN